MFFLVNEELLLSFFQLMRNLIRSHYLASDISPIYPPSLGGTRQVGVFALAESEEVVVEVYVVV